MLYNAITTSSTRTIPGVSSHVGGMEVYRATTRTTQEMGLRLKGMVAVLQDMQ